MMSPFVLRGYIRQQIVHNISDQHIYDNNQKYNIVLI